MNLSCQLGLNKYGVDAFLEYRLDCQAVNTRSHAFCLDTRAIVVGSADNVRTHSTKAILRHPRLKVISNQFGRLSTVANGHVVIDKD